MKLINNQEIRLFDELKSSITNGSRIYLCASYFTIPAIHELSEEFTKAHSIEILIDVDVHSELRFAYDEKEYSQYFDLKSKIKAEKTLSIIKSKAQVREGNVGGQKFILVQNS